jgi:hypothetical protein
MLLLAGAFNLIDGIAAIRDSKYLINDVLFSNLHAWGWFFLFWGALQIVAALAVFSGALWGAIVAVGAAFINMIAQLSWAHVYPVWAISAMVVDALVIYGLIVYGMGREDT